jgi:hypothetical protein
MFEHIQNCANEITIPTPMPTSTNTTQSDVIYLEVIYLFSYVEIKCQLDATDVFY